GIEKLGHQDINYIETVGAASYQSPYRIDPVASSVLSGDYHAFQGDSVVLFVDPYYELVFNLWIDNLTPKSGAVVDFTDPNHEDAAVGIHNEGTNWKTVFWTIDWLALDFRSAADSASMYYWGLTDVGNLLGNVLAYFGDPVSIETEVVSVPKTYSLKQNFPNPFNPTTSIEYNIADKGLVKLSIYNMLGQKVRTLVNANQDANKYRITWNGLDDNGLMVPSGIYFYTLNVNGFNATKKMVFVK
ncbi:MAG: T9SS type A sorting domain-containing protein, partial [Candidatus Marinimicrobia bacterium]|nr:T9SS type A sorting domain-containing protein [Candidatus Neomarinimicrobiota bacterium]